MKREHDVKYIPQFFGKYILGNASLLLFNPIVLNYRKKLHTDRTFGPLNSLSWHFFEIDGQNIAWWKEQVIMLKLIMFNFKIELSDAFWYS